MDSKILELFNNVRIFKGIDEKVISSCYKRGLVFELSAGEELFSQGSSADALYIVLKGQMLAIGYDSAGKTEQICGIIQSGEMLGDMGLISGKPRLLTVRAQRDSTLFKLEREQFDTLMTEYPEILLPIVRRVICRYRQTFKKNQKLHFQQSVLFMSANEHVDIKTFIEFVQQSLSQSDRKAIVVQETDMLAQFGNNASRVEITQWLSKIEADYSLVFYHCNSYDSAWFHYCIELADRFIILADSNTKARYSKQLLQTIQLPEFSDSVFELVLLHHQGGSTSGQVMPWLQPIDYYRHHHIILNDNETIFRFYRFMNGTARALVLSGGATRGWAHIGALRAFSENNMDFDLVGGTSIGSSVAAFYAMGLEYEQISEIVDKFMQANIDSVKLRNLTLPIVSFSSSRDSTRFLQESFSEKRIEELQRLFFCISCNLNKHKEVVHTQGLLWEAIRASCSMPGISPPMVMDGMLHIDGGVMNNLPTDVARSQLDGVGHVTAVDLSLVHGEAVKYSFPPSLPLGCLLADKLKLKRRKHKFTSLSKIMMDTMMTCSERRMVENRKLVDVLIQPTLTGYGMLDDSRDEFIQLGYQAAIEKIS